MKPKSIRKKKIEIIKQICFKEDLISNLKSDIPNLNALLIKLKEDLGSDLFRQLSYSDKKFLIKTSGSLDFGRIIDLNQVAKNTEDYGKRV